MVDKKHDLRLFVVVYNKVVSGDVKDALVACCVEGLLISVDVITVVVPVQLSNFKTNCSSVFSASSIFKSKDVSKDLRRPIIASRAPSGV